MNNEMGFHNEPGSSESPAGPLRVAVVGCGARSAIATLLPTGRAQVTALVDPQAGSRAALARQLAETPTSFPQGPADAAADATASSGGPSATETTRGAPAEFDSVTDLLAGATVDAALVLTPDDTHAEVATTLLRAGVAVYLEKPMTITTGSADAVLSAAAESGSALYVGHNMRHMAVVRTMKEIIDVGQLGRLQAIWCRHFVGNGGDYYFKDWHAERARSTGLLLQKGAHDIDVIHWLAGAYTERVSAMGGLTLYDQVSSRRDNSDRRMPEWLDRQACALAGGGGGGHLRQTAMRGPPPRQLKTGWTTGGTPPPNQQSRMVRPSTGRLHQQTRRQVSPPTRLTIYRKSS